MLALEYPILLASASPRRHELLSQLGLAHTVVAIPVPEGEDEPILDNENPLAYVQRTAMDKAQHAWRFLSKHQQVAPQQLVLCADTTVALGDEILGKPTNLLHAETLLRQLSGRSHHVHTAVVIVKDGQFFPTLSTSTVQFQTLSNDEIQRYCASGECMGKAGAYGIQGRAGAFVQHLEGSYSGVMGLPVHECYALLQQLIES